MRSPHGSAPAALLLAFGLLVSAPAARDGEEGRADFDRTASLTLRVGALEVEDVDEFAPVAGLALGLRFLRHFDVSGGLDYHSADFSTQHRKVLAFSVSLEFHPFKRHVGFQPYGLGGAGLYYAQFELLDQYGDVYVEDIDIESGFHYGVGLDIPCCGRKRDHGRLNLEVRRIFTDRAGDEELEPDGAQVTVGYKVVSE